MMGHAFAEGWFLLRRRWLTSLSLAFGLAVPLSLAALTAAVAQWSWPLVHQAEETLAVPVLLHPRMDESQRESWIADQKEQHPKWEIQEVPTEVLAKRLVLWFPYLQDFFDGEEGSELAPLVEIRAQNPEELKVLEASPAVIALGPTSSVHRILGRLGGGVAFGMACISGIQLFVAILLAGIWTHLEIYRHADEISIMRLVGATEVAIRSPLLMAAISPGLLAGLLGTLGAGFLVHRTALVVESLGLGVPHLSPIMILGLLVAGPVLPGIAAMITLARHAKHES